MTKVLEKVKATYSNMSEYTWSATVTEGQPSASGKNSVDTASILVAVKKPNQFRWEVSGNGAARYTGMYVGEEVIVSDGRDVFWCDPKRKQYTKTRIGPLETPMGSVSAFIKKIEDDFFLGYSLLGQNTAKLLKEEAISRRDGVVDCYVVEITTSSHTVFTWWVDKKRSVVVREDFEANGIAQPRTLTRRTEVNFVQIGGPIDERLFIFSPPAGAELVERFK